VGADEVDPLLRPGPVHA
jgi:hypothetical protein